MPELHPQVRWFPQPETTNHDQAPLAPEADFFGYPPPEIGPIISADTDLLETDQPRSIEARAGIVMGSVFGGLVLGLAFIILTKTTEPAWWIPWLLLPASIFGVIAWLRTRFRRTCHFVGQYGCALFRCSGRRDRVRHWEWFHFSQAAHLRTTMTHRYVNGSYQGTDYVFLWTDDRGLACYRIAGTHGALNELPRTGDLFHYANMAELSWTRFLLERLSAGLDRYGWHQFNLGGDDFLRMGHGWIEFTMRGESTRLDQFDLQQASLAQGIFKVKRHGAQEGWFSSTGVFTFNYRDMANARLFLTLYNQLIGPLGT